MTIPNMAIVYKNGVEVKRVRLKDRKGTMNHRKQTLKFIYASIKRIAYNNPNDKYYIDLVLKQGTIY